MRKALDKSIPFKHIKQLSDSLIDFFFDELVQNNLELKYEIGNILKNQDSFDNYLLNTFNAIFPEMIRISDTNFEFSYFPLRKVVIKLIENLYQKTSDNLFFNKK